MRIIIAAKYYHYERTTKIEYSDTNIDFPKEWLNKTNLSTLL